MKRPLCSGIIRLVSALVILFGGAFFPVRSAGCPRCCERQGTVKKGDFINLHLPDYDEELELYNECLAEQMAGRQFDTYEEARVADSLAQIACAPLDPNYGYDCFYVEILQNYIGQYLTTDYFHLVSQSWYTADTADYVFKGSYVEGLEEINAAGDTVRSRLVLELWYNGAPQELVKRWVTERSINNAVHAHRNVMFGNSDCAMADDKPIHEKLLWPFEKLPVRFDTNPEKTTAGPDERVRITLSNFKNPAGATSREFNRIGVFAEKGRIVNGMPGEYPDIHIFPIDFGDLDIYYRAPVDCADSTDRIIFFNTCEILDPAKKPSASVLPKEPIDSLDISLECENGTVRFSRFYRRRHHGKQTDTTGDVPWVQVQSGLREIGVSVEAELEHLYGMEMPMLNQYWDIYDVNAAAVSSFTGTHYYHQTTTGLAGHMVIDSIFRRWTGLPETSVPSMEQRRIPFPGAGGNAPEGVDRRGPAVTPAVTPAAKVFQPVV